MYSPAALTLLGLLAMLGGTLATSDTTTRACCPADTVFDGTCTKTLCNELSTTNRSGISDFAKACSTKVTTVVYPTLKCLARLAADKPPTTPRTAAAQLYKAVECQSSAQTALCKTGLKSQILSGAIALDEINTAFGNLSGPGMISTCLEARGYDTEWQAGMGMSACAYSGNNTLQVAPNTGTCQECTLPLDQQTVPFCAAHFSSGTTKRYGARCNKVWVADNAARSLHEAWVRNKTAYLPEGESIANPSTTCQKLLRQVACSTTMATCDDATTRSSWCKATCETAFTTACGSTASVAQRICEAIGATSTSSTCSSFDYSSVAEYMLGSDRDTNINIVQASLCLPQSVQMTPETALPVQLHFQALTDAQCRPVGCVGVVSYNAAMPATRTCAFNYTVDVTAPAIVPGAAIVAGFRLSLGQLANGLLSVTSTAKAPSLVLKTETPNSPATVPMVSSLVFFFCCMLSLL